MESIAAGLIAFLSGSSVASALITAHWRGTHKKKWRAGRSVCDVCGNRLPVSAIIPVLGFFLNPACRSCKKTVSSCSAFAEFFVGATWCAIILILREPFDLTPVIVSLTIATILVVAGTLDFYYQQIPVPAVGFGMVAVFVFSFLLGENFMPLILGSFVAAGFFLWQYVLSRGRWIGGGDIWIGAFLGMVFGWNRILLILAVGYFLAAFASIVLLTVTRSRVREKVPLGGFLCLSGLIFLFFNLI